MRQNSDQSELDELILSKDETTPTKEYLVEDFLTDLKCFYQLLNEEDFKKVKNFEQQVLTYFETQDRTIDGVAVYNPQNSIENIFTQLIIGIGQIIVNYENDKLTQLWHGLARIGKRFKFIDTNKLKSVFGLRFFKEWLLLGNVPQRIYADFEDIKKLGRGGFGKVVCARNKLDNVRYALKIIKTSDKKLHRHVSEVHILSVLDHPNIVNYKSSWLERNHSIVGDQNGSDDSSDYSSSNDSEEVKDIPSSNLAEMSGCSGITFRDFSTSNDSGKSYKSGDIAEYALARFRNYSNCNALQVEDRSSISLTLYIQMEKCDMTLNVWLNSKRNLLSGTCNDNHFQDWDKLNSIDVLQGISKALEYIHSKNIVHHDVTPANIFINYNWGVPRVILADFGLACSDRQKVDCNRKGTPTYSTPIDFDAICHPKNDLYSLGIIAYEVALQCGTQYEVLKKIEGLKSYAFKNEDEAINPKLWSIIKKLINREVESRPTAAELLIETEKIYIDSLEQALEGKNVVLKALTIKEANVTQMQQIMEKNRQLLSQLKEKDQQLIEKDLQLMEKDRQLLEKDNQIRKLLEMVGHSI